MKKKALALLLAGAMAMSLAACGSSETADTSAAETPAATEETDAAESTEAAETTGDAAAADAADADYALEKGDYVIGLSNSFYGNTWRKQMVESFTEAAEEAKKAGYIADFEIQNGDGTVNTQIAQINSFILEGVDAICINAASSTALNDVIQQAMKQGIKIIAFDSIIDLDGAYTMDYDWVSMGEKKTQFVMDKIGGKGNVLIVRGPSGAAPDEGIYEGITNVLNKYPDVKIAAEVLGEADATVTQEGILNIISSLPEIDAVITHCGADSMGVVNAFKSMGKDVPLTIGDNTAEFIKWWDAQSKDGYETLSVNSTPSCGAGALWTAVAVLNGKSVPQNMYLPFIYINQNEIAAYSDLQAGEIASPYMTYDYVVDNIFKAQ
ncbi:ABC transporter substrate-binding protein [Clostridiaceae bacterium AM27-36LB]|nr:ABC transporter substrate-binding protein [Clostridiales bacterium AM23-16LB]RHR47021.1 ABC transporter substrate-binding protein [Clostridiaceae bacterium AF18-31LB]RHT83237.1 ABC transporter substrate-binding protein [Clostridiaceae bacterium AM27-36LB]